MAVAIDIAGSVAVTTKANYHPLKIVIINLLYISD